jgi:uncharacterized glyoxalase superfamily protein PhnB/uncharacterized protein YndB with AHSA1/START domain
MDLVTYLAFDGRCRQAFEHYAKVLRGTITMMVRVADAPAGTPVAPGTENLIMHARLEVDGRLLMGGDAPAPHYSKPQGFCAHVMVDDVAEAERIFRELGEGGGRTTMPLGETFWARRFGMLVDRFGTPWMVNCEKNPHVAETAGAPFTISRTFEVARETLWDCFTDVERMKQWWGPKGVSITHATMDLRPGGTFHYCMRTPDGNEMWGRQVYREIAPPERIVLVNSFSDEQGGLSRHPLAPSWPIELLSTFTFAAEGPRRSTLTVTWSPLYPTPEELQTFESGHDSMRQGWTGTLDQLTAYLAKNG